MENKLDKLFRDKLDNHSVKLSANAWERVKTNARPLTPEGGTTSARIAWAWRVAAALVLMGVTGWFAYTQFADQESLQLAQKLESTKEAKQLDAVTKKIKPEEKAIPTDQQKENPAIRKSNLIPQSVIQQTVARTEPEVSQEEVNVSETIVVVETAIEPMILTQPVVEPKKEKPMVIVYSLASVEPKQSVEPVKVKPLRKVIEFAQDVKGGEVTLASVRDWKDNIFGVEELAVVEKQNN